MKIFNNNLKKIFKTKHWIISFIIWILLISIPSIFIIDKDFILFNIWMWFLIMEIILTWIIAILFWIFLASIIHNFFYFRKLNSNTNTNQKSSKKHWVIGFFATIMWVIVSWCPACTIWIAYFLGLSSIFALLPYHWIELKFISALIMIYATYYQVNNIEVCKLKLKPINK